MTSETKASGSHSAVLTSVTKLQAPGVSLADVLVLSVAVLNTMGKNNKIYFTVHHDGMLKQESGDEK